MKINDSIKKVLPVFWFIFVAVLYVVLYIKRINYLLDSDMSSEMVLSDVLTREHGIISKNWFYSTELRFLNNQLIFEFFLLFGHNYHLSRVLGGITLMVILVLSYRFMLKKMGLLEYFFITAPVLMLPFSGIYSDIILTGLYYIPHIAISFCAMGLIYDIENSEEKKKKSLIILAILSLLAGIGGPRQIIIFYLPLLLTVIIRFYITKKLTFKSVYISFVFAVIGYIINSKILIKSYKYNGWEGFKYVNFSSEKLDTILQGFLNVLGFTNGEIFTFATVRTGCAFVILFGVIIYYIYYFKNKKSLTEQEIIAGSFVLTASLIYIIIYLFTDMFYEDRYTLPFIVFLLPLVAFSLKNHGWIRPAKVVFTVLFSLMILANSLLVYKALWFQDKTKDHRMITEYLVSNNYLTGYSTYWNANLLTELSNGKIDSYVWTSDITAINDVDDLYRWLQVKSHKDTKPEGRVFIVLSMEEYKLSYLQRFLGPDNLVYNTEKYFVFGYENYESMVKDLSSYIFDTASNDYAGTAEIADDSFVVNKDAATTGPFITLYKGKYLVNIKGQNLSASDIKFEYSLDENQGINILDPDSVALYGDEGDVQYSEDPLNSEENTIEDPGVVITNNEDGMICYLITVRKNIHDFQIVVSNENDNPVVITDMEIIRK